MTAIVANQNKAKAWMYGFNTSLTATLLPQLSFYTTLNLTHGRYFDASDKEVPLDHIPPVFGKTSVSYLSGKLMTEFFVLYNGWKFIKDYNPYGEDNQQYATAKGMPGWYTLNVRAGYNFIKHFSAEVAMENIMDKSYRTFASGIHAPGRNFVVSLKGNF
jgi:hemoglobin/transferrin/lactoferrin receptor protein